MDQSWPWDSQIADKKKLTKKTEPVTLTINQNKIKGIAI